MNLKDKTVLVTGADGFIGSHLTEMLLPQCAKVKALSYYNSFNHWGWLEDIRELDQIEVISGDVRDSHFVCDITKGVDVVFHLAALIAIPYSYKAPESYVDVNVKGTLNLCQAALQNSCQKVIHTSTSEVYGTAQYVPIDEKHPLQPQSPYSASKISADSMAMSLHNSMSLPLTIVRPFNTYGPRQSARAVIPNIISQLADGKRDISLGSLEPTRDFNYVADTCQGFITCAETDKANGEIFNVGSNSEISIGDLFDLIVKLMKVEGAKVEEQSERLRPKNSEVERLLCNNEKIVTQLGYKPKVDLESGLKKTIAWFSDKNNLKKYKTDIYNV